MGILPTQESLSTVENPRRKKQLLSIDLWRYGGFYVVYTETPSYIQLLRGNEIGISDPGGGCLRKRTDSHHVFQ